jgi:hypothetical protein
MPHSLPGRPWGVAFAPDGLCRTEKAVARLARPRRGDKAPPVPLARPSDAPRATVTPGAAAPRGPEGAVFPATPRRLGW